jgi:hypothetical protein
VQSVCMCTYRVRGRQTKIVCVLSHMTFLYGKKTAWKNKMCIAKCVFIQNVQNTKCFFKHFYLYEENRCTKFYEEENGGRSTLLVFLLLEQVVDLVRDFRPVCVCVCV